MSPFASERPILAACSKLSALLLSSFLLVFLSLYAILPPFNPVDLPKLRLPTSFSALKSLNSLLQTYKDDHYYPVLAAFIILYLFLQAFSLPGSMYLSILAGAIFGVQVALPLVCLCVATGALLCYSISCHLATPLVIYLPSLRHRLESWNATLATKTNPWDLFAYLIVIRISPVPPHWVVNILAPHLGISLLTFWLTTGLGILPISFIHTQLGTTLHEIVRPQDISLLNAKNLSALALIAFAVLIPVGIRWYLIKNRSDLILDSTLVGESCPGHNPISLNLQIQHDRHDALENDDEDDDDDDDRLDINHHHIHQGAIHAKGPLRRFVNGYAYQNLTANSSSASLGKPAYEHLQQSALILSDLPSSPPHPKTSPVRPDHVLAIHPRTLLHHPSPSSAARPAQASDPDPTGLIGNCLSPQRTNVEEIKMEVTRKNK